MRGLTSPRWSNQSSATTPRHHDFHQPPWGPLAVRGVFTRQKNLLRPEFFLLLFQRGDWDAWSGYLGGLAGYYPRGHTRSGLYAEAELGSSIYQGSNQERTDDLMMGIGLGYRVRIGPVFVWRAQVQYRRWHTEFDSNDLSVLVSLGARR